MPLYRSSVNGAERNSADVLGYPWIEVDEDAAEPMTTLGGDLVGTHFELAAPTADAILAEVGNDADLAQIALDEEQARETPRKVLSAKLQRIVDNAQS